MFAITLVLLLTSLFGADVHGQKNNLHQSENVFGWQKERRLSISSTGNRHRFSHIPSKSPLLAVRQSENVFRWQFKPQTNVEIHHFSSRRRNISSANSTRVINTSLTRNNHDPQNVSINNIPGEAHFNNFNITPPNIKIQPHKKEGSYKKYHANPHKFF